MRVFFELLVELVPHRQERDGRVHDQHQRQDGRVPGGQADANRRRRPPTDHGSPSRTTNPTPRTVWISRGGAVEIDFASKPRHLHVDDVVERRRAARLLPDIARQHLARHEMPLMAQQVLEQLELAAGQVDRAVATDDSPCDEVHFEVGRPSAEGRPTDGPRRSSARIRASSSGSANGLTR